MLALARPGLATLAGVRTAPTMGSTIDARGSVDVLGRVDGEASGVGPAEDVSSVDRERSLWRSLSDGCPDTAGGVATSRVGRAGFSGEFGNDHFARTATSDTEAVEVDDEWRWENGERDGDSGAAWDSEPRLERCPRTSIGRGGGRIACGGGTDENDRLCSPRGVLLSGMRGGGMRDGRDTGEMGDDA